MHTAVKTTAVVTKKVRERVLAETPAAELFEAFLAAFNKIPRKDVAALFEGQESIRDRAKSLYDQADILLKKLVRAWKKNKSAPVDSEHRLEIEDSFRGALKAFAPAFAHRYKLKLRKLNDVD